MRILTPRFGELNIPEDTIITFPEGLPGFDSKRWVVFSREETPMIEWLQSIDEPEIALMVMDPVDLLLDYDPKPKAGELNPVHPEGEEDLVVRVIIRNAEHKKLSVNLFAPLFFNVGRHLGMQLPLVGSGYQVNEIWPPDSITIQPPPDEAPTPRTESAPAAQSPKP